MLPIMESRMTSTLVLGKMLILYFNIVQHRGPYPKHLRDVTHKEGKISNS